MYGGGGNTGAPLTHDYVELVQPGRDDCLDYWLATDPTGSGDPDVLVIRDLNSYRNERPITTLETAGYTDLLERFVGDAAYTYVFDCQLGYLDYVLANPVLNAQVTGATSWHTNADEIPLLDYNDAVLDIGEASFERESSALPRYAADPFRASDHDAVVVGLALNRAPVADAGGPYMTRPREQRNTGRVGLDRS